MDDLISLVQRAQEGDVEAFTSIVERFQDMAYGYGYAILGDFRSAEDIAQEAFIEAYHSLQNLKEPLAFPAWFKRILYKHCDRLIRNKQYHSLSLEADGDVASGMPGPATVVEQRELARQVRQAILGLPVDQRVVTALYYINGYSQREIASFLEVPAKTVKSRLHSSRLKLKERMLEMVADELKNNPLSDNFARDTVEIALRQAHNLNQEEKYGEAEIILRDILSQAPGHPRALTELNRAVWHGQVYGRGRWDMLVELVQHGQEILKAGEDEWIRGELAKTLLAIPAMPQAIDFLEQWISISGSNLERLGMLAWAKTCVGDFSSAERTWQALWPLAEKSQVKEDINRLSFIAMTLADSFASAKEVDYAQKIANQAWNIFYAKNFLADVDYRAILEWIAMFFQAELDYKNVARILLAGVQSKPGLEGRGTRLCIQVHLDSPEIVVKAWLAFAKDCIAAKEWRWLKKLRNPILMSLRRLGESEVQLQLAQATWELLQEAAVPEMVALREGWNESRFDFFTYYQQKDWASLDRKNDRSDWESMERVSWRGIHNWKLAGNATGVIVAVAAQGKPTPVELIKAYQVRGVESVDPYGLFGWYMVAREAAATGDQEKAFDALRRSLNYWSNPPYVCIDIWEQDTFWSDLRNHPEFKRIFAEKRQRIGPIHGILHYFPDW